MLAKIVEIPDSVRHLVPSDFVKDAQRIMRIMGDHPIGPTVECRPLIEDGVYVLPQWTIHYEIGGIPARLNFAAPFRYIRNLLRDDPELHTVFAAAAGFGSSAPSTAKLLTRQGRYEAEATKYRLEVEKEEAVDLSDLV